MQNAMLAALHPYRRIRAIVGAVFVLTVTALVIASMYSPRHSGGAAASGPAVAAPAVSGPAVAAPATRAP